MPVIDVAVGVVLREGAVFLSLRPSHVHQGGKWEFPGGKVEAGESALDALRRELFEEIGLEGNYDTQALVTVTHDYGEKRVCLQVFVVQNFTTEPSSQEQLQTRWVPIEQLNADDFPAANVPIIEALQQRVSTV